MKYRYTIVELSLNYRLNAEEIDNYTSRKTT